MKFFLAIVWYFVFLHCIVLGQPYQPQYPQYAPGAVYQPAVVYVPTWHSGPFGIIWFRTWTAYPVQPQQVPQQ